MNPVPRLVALVLFAVLVALAAILAVPLWQGGRPTPPTSGEAPADTVAGNGTAPRTPRVLLLSQRAALALAVAALALTVALLLSAVARPARSEENPHPFGETRTEVSALARLAESSVAQGAELTRERDVRRRAEEDARLKQQLLAHELEEKIRLGRDLHDGIIQSVYAAGLTLESVRALVRSDPDEAIRRLDRIRSGLNDTIRDIRGYITGLAPESLRQAGFAHALTQVLHDLRAGGDAHFEIQVDEEAAARLSADQSIEVLQIAREAASNALRHGHASKITLRMHVGDGAVCLLVQDDGCGFNPERVSERGHGLANMKARADRVGAELRVTSRGGEGTRILATLPISPSAAA